MGCLSQSCHCRRAAAGKEYIGSQADKLRRKFATAINLAGWPPIIDSNIAANGQSLLLKTLLERSDARTSQGIILGSWHQNADASSHAVALLRSRGKWPTRCCPADPCNENPPSHVALRAPRFFARYRDLGWMGTGFNRRRLRRR
jgi:hypothetical protein